MEFICLDLEYPLFIVLFSRLKVFMGFRELATCHVSMNELFRNGSASGIRCSLHVVDTVSHLLAGQHEASPILAVELDALRCKIRTRRSTSVAQHKTVPALRTSILHTASNALIRVLPRKQQRPDPATIQALFYPRASSPTRQAVFVDPDILRLSCIR